MTEERKWRGENGYEPPPEEQLRLNQRSAASGVRLDNFDEVFDRLNNDASFFLRLELMFMVSTIQAAKPARKAEREERAWDVLRLAVEVIVHLRRMVPGLPPTPELTRSRDVWATLFTFVEWCDMAAPLVRPAQPKLSPNDRRLLMLTLQHLRAEAQKPEAPDEAHSIVQTSTPRQRPDVRPDGDGLHSVTVRDSVHPALPLLSEPACVFRDILLARSPIEPITGPALCDQYEKQSGKGIDDGEFRKRIVPPLKAWGMQNKRRVGYYFPADAAARKSRG